MARTVGERDRARGSEVTRPRTRDQAKVYREREERKQQRRAAGKPPRIEEATSMQEALEAEREAGRREGSGAAGSTPRPASGAINPAAARTSSPRSPSSTVPGVTVPMVADVFIITVDELTQAHRLPVPSRLLVAFAIFGVLGLAKGSAAQPAKVMAWGIVIATFYSAAPGGKPPALSALNALGDFLGGKYGTVNDNIAKAAQTSPDQLHGQTSIINFG